jgi:hypothetical protein
VEGLHGRIIEKREKKGKAEGKYGAEETGKKN